MRGLAGREGWVRVGWGEGKGALAEEGEGSGVQGGNRGWEVEKV